MPAAPHRTRRAAPANRQLLEWSAASSAGSPLKVDREKGVIYGVKVCGFRSKNSHGMREATDGSEYTRQCLEDARPLYEGADVLIDHDPASKDRSSFEVFGQLRNYRVEDDGGRADLHFLTSHPMAPRVCEDVERGIGVYGLSHDARAERERFDPARRRLVIEKLRSVNSVDLVRRPATNRNLWEDREPPMKTVRQLVEGLIPKLTPKWRRRLFEDGMAPAMDAPMPEGDAGATDLKAGLMAALAPLLDEAFESGDAGKAVAALKDFVKLHAKHAAGEAPADDELEEQVGDGSKNQDGQKGAMEFFDADDRKSRHESLSAENARLKAEKAARRLCESLGYPAATEEQVEFVALAADDGKRRRLVETFKAAAKAARPSSPGAPGGGGGSGGPPAKAPADAKEFAARVRG